MFVARRGAPPPAARRASASRLLSYISRRTPPVQRAPRAAQDGSEVFFKIKRKSPLKKLMDVYAQRQGGTVEAYRFLFDGTRVQAEQTPDELEMEDDDVIDCFLEQTGGAA